MDEMELTDQLKKELSIQVAKNAILIKENESLKGKLVGFIVTMQEIEDKLQDSDELKQKYQSKNEAHVKHIAVLEDSIRNLEKKIEEQKYELSRIPIEYVPLSEKESLNKELQDLRSRYKSQEEILKASYNKVFDGSSEAIKIKLEKQFNGATPSFEEMTNFFALERESWTAEHKNLLNDLQNKNTFIEALEKDIEDNKLKQQAMEINRIENDEKLKEKVNHFEKNIENLTISYQTLGAKYAKSKSDLKSLDTKSKNKSQKISQLQRNISSLTQSNNELKKRLEEYEEEGYQEEGYQEEEKKITSNELRITHSKIKKRIKGGGGKKIVDPRVMSVLNIR